jgi:polyhydroxyalkanoate synthesis regulator phasin
LDGDAEPDGAPEVDERSAGFAEELLNVFVKPLDLVLLSRERLQAILDEWAELGRVTRADANELVSELVRLGRQQTDTLLSDIADRARRTVGAERHFPVPDYEDLTVAQVMPRLTELTPSQLRQVRDFERRHANRKSVLAAIEKALS